MYHSLFLSCAPVISASKQFVRYPREARDSPCKSARKSLRAQHRFPIGTGLSKTRESPKQNLLVNSSQRVENVARYMEMECVGGRQDIWRAIVKRFAGRTGRDSPRDPEPFSPTSRPLGFNIGRTRFLVYLQRLQRDLSNKPRVSYFVAQVETGGIIRPSSQVHDLIAHLRAPIDIVRKAAMTFHPLGLH
jgi:hypothetical protein